MNLHNNKAGRMVSPNPVIPDKIRIRPLAARCNTATIQALSRLMLMKCRCHGVSGSCEFKTCWRSLPRFADIGDYLKEKYDKSAVKVSGLQDEKSSGRFRRGLVKKPVELPVSKRSLVYIQPSPDYCSDDPQVSQHSTKTQHSS